MCNKMKSYNFPLNCIIKQIVAVNIRYLEESPLSALSIITESVK